MTWSNTMNVEEIAARVAYESGPNGIYPHSTFTVGIIEVSPEESIVGINATMGKAKFQFVLRPDQARATAQWMLRCAEKVDPGGTTYEFDN